jgi:hypothetical protein
LPLGGTARKGHKLPGPTCVQEQLDTLLLRLFVSTVVTMDKIRVVPRTNRVDHKAILDAVVVCCWGIFVY